MTTDELRAAAARLVSLHGEVIDCFGRREAREHSLVYLKGLLLHHGSKTAEGIALHFAPGHDGQPAGRAEVEAMQHFLTASPWDQGALQRRMQRIFVRELVPSAAASPIGVVGVIDETGDEKSGPHSCGAASQWFGRAGKTENCQMGVFLLGVTPAGTTLLDHQLYLPKGWTKDRVRRRRTRVPKEIKFRTKPELAIDLIKRTLAGGEVRFDWITADALYGKDGDFLDALEQEKQRYVVETAHNTCFWTVDPATQVPTYSGRGRHPVRPSRDMVRHAKQLAAELPADAWQVIQLREGTKGPLVAEFARLRVWSIRDAAPGPLVWLMFRRDVDSGDVKYFVSNGDAETPLEVLAQVSAARHCVEAFFEDGKGDFGLADYEARGWTSWRHHMSLVGLAHLYVVLTRQTLGRHLPQLTLDRALNLIQAALAHPQLSLEQAQHLLVYHTHQNEVARKSHSKSWLRKHKHLKAKLPL
jgi:SRSO17 transposase